MSIRNQLKGIDIRKLKTSNGQSLDKLLYIEAQRLKDCIQYRLDNYLASYSPVMYKRTGGLQSSLKVDSFLNVKVVGNALEIRLFFNDNANHMSGDGLTGWFGSKWKGTGEEVNAAFLLEYGYRVKKDVWFKNIKNFGYRKAAHFVQDGIDDFNMANPLGIKVIIKQPNGYLV